MKKILYALALAALCGPAASAQSVTLSFTPVVSGLTQPVDVVRAPSDTDRLFIVQKTGAVRIVKNGVLQPGNFLNISSIISVTGEQGLLSLAFHPQHATNRMFWVVYNDLAGDIVLARYGTLLGDTNTADPASATIVTTVPHPVEDNHNGGRILFGSDGYLYWSVGDGGGGGDPNNNAQTGTSRLGKMLRLDVSTGNTAPFFSTPPTNPFVSNAGFDPLVYQYGLRNPFRWSFDRLNGDMWIGDVGQGAWEEVDRAATGAQAGVDWGWRCREGAHVYNSSGGCASGSYTGFTDPVFEYARGSGSSITGGYVYRGADHPALYGRYVCADYIKDSVFVVSPNGSGGYVGEKQTTAMPASLVGFGENARGELFAVSLSGVLYAISATGTPLSIEKDLNFVYRPAGNNCGLFSWSGSADVARYALEWSADARRFEEVASAYGVPYEVTLCCAERRAGFYRLRSEERNGSITYSGIVRVGEGAALSTISLSPNPLRSGEVLHITTETPLADLTVRDLQGRVVRQFTKVLKAGVREFNLNVLPAGVYVVYAVGISGTTQTHRLIIR